MPAGVAILLLGGSMTIPEVTFIFSEDNIMHFGGGVLNTEGPMTH